MWFVFRLCFLLQQSESLLEASEGRFTALLSNSKQIKTSKSPSAALNHSDSFILLYGGPEAPKENINLRIQSRKVTKLRLKRCFF